MSGNTRQAPASVVVAGSGPVALAAAVGMAQALPGARVTTVPAPVDAAALADRAPLALPSTFATLARLGCPADALLAHGVARARLATRYTDWSGDGSSFLLGDDAAPSLPGMPLHQLWLRARGPVPFHTLIPACVAAERGAAADGSDVALHLDPQRLMQVLGSLARRTGVVAAGDAAVAEVETDGDGVAALRLHDGTRLTANLFVDATGPACRVAGALASEREDWRAILPCTRVTIADDPEPYEGIDTCRATPEGWTTRWPGTCATWTDGDEGADTPGVAVAPGRLTTAWRGNVLALGEAAAQVGPLGLFGFTLAIGQLALALELLPARADEPLLRAEYNRRAGLRADRLRDLAALPYWGTTRCDGVWGRFARERRPAGLAAVLAQFERRGHLPPADEESVARDAWIALLIGLGIRPERAHPVAMSIAPDRAAAIVTELAARLRADMPHKDRSR